MAVIAQDAYPYDSAKDELRFRSKIDLILAQFGSELLETPISDLKLMAEEECGSENPQNLFCRMWDAYRFIPSARWLRRFGNAETQDFQNIVDVMEAVWGE